MKRVLKMKNIIKCMVMLALIIINLSNKINIILGYMYLRISIGDIEINKIIDF